MAELLSLAGVHARYGAIDALHGIDLSVSAGGAVALLGANGAGKTTTLRAISRMVRTTGAITLDGASLAASPPERVAALGVAHVPADRGTFLPLSVAENLRLGGYLRRDKREVQRDVERMYDLFPRLRDRAGQQAGTLSGGEQQMLAVARAMMMRPRLLLLDEPSFGLAPMIVAEIFEVFGRIKREQSVAMLIVEQNARLALSLADRAYLIETGRIVLSGPSVELMSSDIIQRSYLGY